jgi:hypothetical protein
MQLMNLATLLLAAASSALAVTVSYDTIYDNNKQSLDAVACSDGENGLESKVRIDF